MAHFAALVRRLRYPRSASRLSTLVDGARHAVHFAALVRGCATRAFGFRLIDYCRLNSTHGALRCARSRLPHPRVRVPTNRLLPTGLDAWRTSLRSFAGCATRVRLPDYRLLSTELDTRFTSLRSFAAAPPARSASD